MNRFNRIEVVRAQLVLIKQQPYGTTENILNTMTWSLYIIEASDASLYTGISTDVDRRFEEHVSGNKGAKFFNGRKPVRVVYVENGHTRSSASKREAEIKKMSRLEKKTLIAALP